MIGFADIVGVTERGNMIADVENMNALSKSTSICTMFNIEPYLVKYSGSAKTLALNLLISESCCKKIKFSMIVFAVPGARSRHSLPG